MEQNYVTVSICIKPTKIGCHTTKQLYCAGYTASPSDSWSSGQCPVSIRGHYPNPVCWHLIYHLAHAVSSSATHSTGFFFSATFRLHRCTKNNMLHCYRCGVVCLCVSVCLFDTNVSPAKDRPKVTHWDQSIKPNHLHFRLIKRKQNKYVMNDVLAYGGIITAADRTLILKSFFLRLPVRRHDRSERRFVC